VPESLSLGVRGPYDLALFDLGPPPPLDDGDVAVRTLYSGLSAGTELTYVKGTDPGFTSRRDPELGIFVPGAASRRYPVTAMGYMEVGQVVDSRRPDLPAGTVIAGAYGHRSSHVLGPADIAVPVPADVDPVLGIYLAQMGPICANGLLHAAAEFRGEAVEQLGDGVRGRRVVVTGAGVVGLLTALLAVEHGAREVLVADPDGDRLAAASALGLDVLDQRDGELWWECKKRWVHGPSDRGADLVLQCRGQAGVLHEALRCLRPQGVVIDLAFYTGGADELRLGEEFHHNGLTIRCAQIARVPRGLAPAWGRRRLAEETGRLLAARGDDLRRHLITHVVPITEAPQVVLGLARRELAARQVVFTFAEGETPGGSDAPPPSSLRR
jgi:threonine dehydrogenase-like Zn-dependent dehydrogenase